MYTSIRFWVARVKYDYDFKIGNTLLDVNLAFLVLYFCAFIEVMTWAVIAFWKRKTEIRGSHFPTTPVICLSATVPFAH